MRGQRAASHFTAMDFIVERFVDTRDHWTSFGIGGSLTTMGNPALSYTSGECHEEQIGFWQIYLTYGVVCVLEMACSVCIARISQHG